MPWCPKCKSEYRVGFTVCADCGTELVDEEPLEKPVEEGAVWANEKMLSEKEQIAQELLEKTDRNEQELSGLADENSPILSEQSVENREMEAEDSTAGKKNEGFSYAPYQDSSERASENRSSGWILLIIGAIGIVLVILGATDILPIRMGNPYLFFGVMGAIFILFLVSGVMSIKNAKIFDKKAESENSLRSTLLNWCKENFSASEIDQVVKLEEDTEEILYFKRFNYIKEKLNRQFVNLDQGFLDKFIDDFVYEEIFEKSE